jgi:hypothetical protein
MLLTAVASSVLVTQLASSYQPRVMFDSNGSSPASVVSCKGPQLHQYPALAAVLRNALSIVCHRAFAAAAAAAAAYTACER